MTKSVSVKRTGIWSLPTHAERFAKIVSEIDAEVFRPHRAHLDATVIPRRFPGSASPGQHVKKVVTYRILRPVHPLTKRVVGRDIIEAYLLWGDEIERIANEKFRNTAVDDMGDAKFLRMLVACALVVVRCRVLAHKEWFPNARFRTLAGVCNDVTLPEQHRAQFFAKRREIEGIVRKPALLDAHLLLMLIQMAQDDGTKVMRALHLLTNDPPPTTDTRAP